MIASYDYIISGSGCAGLSLAYYLSKISKKEFKCLLIDKESKDSNDRTWSFWQKEDAEFDRILANQYHNLSFHTNEFEKVLEIEPYSYKMIRSKEFYDFILSHLKTDPRFNLITNEIKAIRESSDSVEVDTNQHTFSAPLVFSSFHSQDIEYGKHQNVLQHFKGWVIETEEDTFDPNSAVFMDFRINQEKDVRFMYVLPNSPRSALVELAVFSNEIWDSKKYDEIVGDYIGKELSIQEYKVIEEEFGIIPMTTYPFEKHNTSRIKYIGSAGGWVKASSGYAFLRIQEKAKQLSRAIDQGSNLDSVLSAKNSFRFYDQIFLNAILTGKASGAEVFGSLFKKLPPQLIFKFLDEKTNALENMKLFTGPPTWAFMKGFFEEVLIR